MYMYIVQMYIHDIVHVHVQSCTLYLFFQEGYRGLNVTERRCLDERKSRA